VTGHGPDRRHPPDPPWVKARRSDNAYACVEVLIRDSYLIRDSKHTPHGPILDLDPEEWTQLCTTLVGFHHDEHPTRRHRAATIGSVRATVRSDGHLELTGRTTSDPRTSATLTFTPIEYQCFVDGITNGEFTTPATPAEV